MGLFNFLKLVSPRHRIYHKASKIANEVEGHKNYYRNLTDVQLLEESNKLVDLVTKQNYTILDVAVAALALIREVVYRETGEFAYRVQIIGAYIVLIGDFAEMMTGEGKTLTIVLAAYVSALEKRGVHVVTVNEYLAQRDATNATKILKRVGMTVGCNFANLAPHLKQAAFACDVTYTTNSELGFDYLRDNMVHRFEDKKIRELHFAIVDEGDSVLIDEARTPLIISGPAKNEFAAYVAVDRFVKKLKEDEYKIDPESRAPALTELGIKHAEKNFKTDNLFALENSDLFHKIINALTAVKVFEQGKEYIVRDGKVLIVDHFTGRILEGRSYSNGLHQAVQAKEMVEIEPENVIVATITYQSFFRLYNRLSAVSGTAFTESEEFLKIYNMVVVPVPTNRPNIRKDRADSVFGTPNIKWLAVVKEVKRIHETGRPILIGTANIDDSELLHNYLQEANIPHEVLNAKNHSREAEIVAKAGQKGAVTISTNMAGRGTDIRLGEGVAEMGGLYVLGTERNESRRIDNQLRGRAGRQGDRGETKFFISLGDALFKRFAHDRIERAITKLGNDTFDSSFFSKMLSRTQKRVEAINFDTRKNLIDYDHVLASQRELIYKQRDKFLLATDLSDMIDKMLEKFVEQFCDQYRNPKNQNLVNHIALSEALNLELNMHGVISPKLFENMTFDATVHKTHSLIGEKITNKVKVLTPPIALIRFREIMITAMDEHWIEHLDNVFKLREGVTLRSMEQTSPLNVYIRETDILFQTMLQKIARDVIIQIANLATPEEFDEELMKANALKKLQALREAHEKSNEGQ
ncbi:preprotein translocase subunit SecA [Mycoplasmoides pneumoniae]|uniref:preprotein translocase subunit SecA n=1 Tax=Mycoplasmoides pneumoniae TaxID=2104 RepID=UPI0013307F45|nr:preprotein translocase subunit SecA [Mycoplasmoides pneumoniae]